MSDLQWRLFNPIEFPDPDFPVPPPSGRINFQLPVGYAARDAGGRVWLVGDMGTDGCTLGCGCCSDDIEIVEVADLGLRRNYE